MNYILAVKLGIRTRAWHHIHDAVHVHNIYMPGSLALTNQCLSQFLWCGDNRRIILPTANVVERKTDGYNSKSKHTIVYPNIPSALRPVEHDDSLPTPKPPQQWTLHE
jgi:hypothetical protein